MYELEHFYTFDITKQTDKISRHWLQYPEMMNIDVNS